MDIRSQVQSEILDYQQLMSLLQSYNKPRDRIGRLLSEGSLIRVRKGLYVFGDSYRQSPICREVLANLIYGPSYVSLDYALSYYGLIPERIETVTSVTTGEKRKFTTPIGVFSYQPLAARRYLPGVQWAGQDDTHFLIASPEKALVDKAWTDKGFHPTSLRQCEAYLLDDLRLDPNRLEAMDPTRMAGIVSLFASRKIDLLARCLARRWGTAHEPSA